jgi:hypothetical protein
LTFQEIVEQFDDPALWIPGTNAEEFLEYRRRIMPGPGPPPAPKEEIRVPEKPPNSGRRGQTLTDLGQIGDQGAIAALSRGHQVRTIPNPESATPPRPFKFVRKP